MISHLTWKLTFLHNYPTKLHQIYTHDIRGSCIQSSQISDNLDDFLIPFGQKSKKIMIKLAQYTTVKVIFHHFKHFLLK